MGPYNVNTDMSGSNHKLFTFNFYDSWNILYVELPNMQAAVMMTDWHVSMDVEY